MTYSQKYCLVHFIEPISTDTKFHMTEWPLHITLADVFAIDRTDETVDATLKNLCEQQESIVTTGLEESILGTTPVVLLDTTYELSKFHSNLVAVLEKLGATFNTPAFNNEGYIPHSTIQGDVRVRIGQQISINSLSLIDMFPSDDWQQRSVLATYDFES